MDSSWAEYKRRRRAFWLALCLAPLWIIPGALISSLLVVAGLGYKWVTFLAVALPPLVSIEVAYTRWIRWRCPRCGKPFHFGWLYGNALSRRCIHCGLPLWTTGDQPRPDPR
jgi:hypothetical protein